MVANPSTGQRRYVITISRWVNRRLEVRIIGLTSANSMPDLMQKLQIGEFASSALPQLKVSMFFTDITDMQEVSTPEELLAQLKKALT